MGKTGGARPTSREQFVASLAAQEVSLGRFGEAHDVWAGAEVPLGRFSQRNDASVSSRSS